MFPASGQQAFRAMAYNNAWANHRLLSACAGLTQAEFVATRTSFFPSLHETLNHIMIVDAMYIDALEGSPIGRASWKDPDPLPTVAELHRAQAGLDRRLIAATESLGDDGLSRIVEVFRATRVQRERMDHFLLHLFQHQVHHRGQAHAMLAGTSVAPPQLDEFFCVGEAPLRAKEFAELGWTEETVWGEP